MTRQPPPQIWHKEEGDVAAAKSVPEDLKSKQRARDERERERESARARERAGDRQMKGAHREPESNAQSTNSPARWNIGLKLTFALEIAPLLGLAGKLAAGATSCCLSAVVTANRVHHATPSYFSIVCKQAHYDDTRGDVRGGWRNGPSGRTFGWRNWQDRRRQISSHYAF